MELYTFDKQKKLEKIEEVWYELQSIPPKYQREVFYSRLFLIPITNLNEAVSRLQNNTEISIMPFYYYPKEDMEILLQYPKSVIKTMCTYFTVIDNHEIRWLYRMGFHDTFEMFYEEIINEM